MTIAATSRQALIDRLTDQVQQLNNELDLAHQCITELKNRTMPEGWDAPIETYEQTQLYIDQLERQLRAKDYDLALKAEHLITAQALANERRIAMYQAEIAMIRTNQKTEHTQKRADRIAYELDTQRMRNADLKDDLLKTTMECYRTDGSRRAAWFCAGVLLLICGLLAAGLYSMAVHS